MILIERRFPLESNNLFLKIEETASTSETDSPYIYYTDQMKDMFPAAHTTLVPDNWWR